MKKVPHPATRESRSTRRIEAYLRRQDGRGMRAILTNISSRGCGLKAGQALAIDELVRIEVPRAGSVAATIRWTAEGEAGAEFLPESDVWEEAPNSDAELRRHMTD
jgi:hypothetical protein